MDHHSDQICPQTFCVSQLLLQLFLVQGGACASVIGVEPIQRKILILRNCNPVGSVGVSQKSHGNSSHVRYNDTVVLGERFLGPVGSHVLEPRLVQNVQRPGKPLKALIHAVIVGRGDQIESDGFQVIRQGIGSTELGIP